MKFKGELDPLNSVWIKIIQSDLSGQINRLLVNQVTSVAHNTKDQKPRGVDGVQSMAA